MREETMFAMKRSASAAVRKAFNELIDTIPLPVNAALDAIIFYFVDEDVNQSWVFHLNKLKEQGETYLSAEERREFLLDLSSQAMKKFTYELDPSSRLLMMGGTNLQDTIGFNLKFPDCLLSNFKLAGTYGCIDGLPRNGKTSLATTFIKILGEKGFTVLTNIKVKDAPGYIKYHQKLSTLIKDMDKIKNRWVCILDETATFAYKKRALSTANVDFENLTRFVGKLNGRLIMITHSFEMDVPTILQTWITERYTKKTLDTAYVHLARGGGYMKMHKLITGIPDAELEYVTEDITSLQFDISIKGVLDRIQDNVSIEQAVDEQLKVVKVSKKGPTKKDRIIELLSKGWRNRDIAKEVGTAIAYVSDIKNSA